MSYVVLARKWRPMSFADLVGQEHVARTLSNAIGTGRVAHAFLFTGVRGVGKTTSARILAKALNCMRKPGSLEPGSPDPGPTAEPCLECPACLEIAAGTDVDVREIDAASHTGVDDVRKIQESLPFRPARDRYKILIVDEVHMLSTSAWNAFLKTLEEPPPHVKFIFATTEVHKVPVTILSRVQRFDFKMIPSRVIAARLAHVLDREGIRADEAALAIVAREAAGSMRDAMSLLDQVIAWGGQDLRGEEVSRVLGVASHTVLHQLASALVQGDASRALEVVEELASQGYEITHAAKDLLRLLRDLVVAKVARSPEVLLDLPDVERSDVVALAGRADADDLVRIHQGFSAGFDEVVRSGQPRIALEMLLVRLARRPPLLPIDELVARLTQLERRLGAGRPNDGGRSNDGGRGGEGRGGPPPRPGNPSAPSGGSRGPRASADAQPADEAPASGGPASGGPVSVRPKSGGDTALTHAPKSVVEAWRGIIERVAEKRPELAAFLQHAAPLEIGTERIRLAIEPNSVFVDQVGSAECQDAVLRAAHAELGSAPRLELETDDARLYFAKSSSTVAAADAEARERKRREDLARAYAHPRIREAIEILGARVRQVTLPD